MAHTPGPWEIQTVLHGSDEVGFNVNAKRHDPAHASEFPYFCIESRADAHLIAAAPELLEALKGFMASPVWRAVCDEEACGCQTSQLFVAAEAAIAKAEGRQ